MEILITIFIILGITITAGGLYIVGTIWYEDIYLHKKSKKNALRKLQ